MSIKDKSSIKAPISSPVTSERQEASIPPRAVNKSRRASLTVSGSWPGHSSLASKSLNLSDPVRRSPRFAPRKARRSQARLSTHFIIAFMALIATDTSKLCNTSFSAFRNAFQRLFHPTVLLCHFGRVKSYAPPSGILQKSNSSVFIKLSSLGSKAQRGVGLQGRDVKKDAMIGTPGSLPISLRSVSTPSDLSA